MKKYLALFLFLFLVGWATTPLAQAKIVKFLEEDVEIMPLSNIKTGMIGYGKSDFGRSQGVEEFSVEIARIIYEDSVDSSVIWIKFPKGSNDIIDTKGVSSGMSGSPIYIKENGQEKLIGALAYGFNFQPLIPPIDCDAGVKPIEDMLALENWITTYYGQVNIQPNANPNILKPGEAIAGVLAVGDIYQAAVGTVTLSNSKGFLAFGHPFLKTGYSNIPVFKAEIGMVVSTILSSFKWTKAIPEPQLGTVIIDSFAGILGLWHNKSTMLPLNIDFTRHYLSGSETNRQWAIKIAPRNPLSSQIFIGSILAAIELSGPNLNKLSFDVKVKFTYKEKGLVKTALVSKNFFSKERKELLEKMQGLKSVYNIFEEARKELIKIEASILANEEKAEIPVIQLRDVEAKEKVAPQKEISLGIKLNDRYRIYEIAVDLKAPSFQGKIEIDIQDREHRLKSLIKKALENPAEINNVLDFIKTSANKDEIFYIEIKHIKSITKQKDEYKNWKITARQSEECVNEEIKEVELPKIKMKFNTSIFLEKKIVIEVKEEQDKKEKN